MTDTLPTVPFDGIFLIDKAEGLTSFSVIARLRRLFGLRRIGHTGTLDPFATGLLPVCLGRATGAVSMMEGFDKRYLLTVELGRSTDSGDTEGDITDEDPFDGSRKKALLAQNAAELSKAAARLTAIDRQVPPMHSAVKIGGQRLYKLARAGKTVERPARPIRIYTSTLTAVEDGENWPKVTLDIRCSKGTYLREIARSYGALLGLNAHASALRRTEAGPFSVASALTVEQVEQLAEDPAARRQSLSAQGRLLDIASAFPDALIVEVDAAEYRGLIYGRLPERAAEIRPLSGPKSGAEPARPVPCCFLYNGRTAALAAFDDDRGALKIKRVFRSNEDLHESE